MADQLSLWKKSQKSHRYVTCDRCGNFRAKSLPSIKYHYKRCGQEVESINCPICGDAVSYTTKAGLQYHMKTAHADSPPPASPVNVASLPFDLAPRKAAERANKKLNEMSSMNSSTTPPSGKAVVRERDREREEVGLCSEQGCFLLC